MNKHAASARAFVAKVCALAGDGGITHTPTSGGVCPVPHGVEFTVRLRNGSVLAGARNLSWELGSPGLRQPCDGDIVSWWPNRSEQ